VAPIAIDQPPSIGRRSPALPRVALIRSIVPLLGIATFFGGWILVTSLNVVSPKFLPSPGVVLRTMLQLTSVPYAGSTLQAHLLASLEKFFISFFIAVVSGVTLGLLMGRSRIAQWAFSPPFESFRFVPPIAWVPFAIFWFGTGFLAPTLVIFAGAFAPCVINAYRGAQLVDKTLLEASQTLGASRLRTVTEVVLPAALTHIVAGIRVGAGFGWQSLIGAELIVGATGLGYMIVQAGSNLQPAIVVSGMITIGIVGAAMDYVMRAIQHRVRRKWAH
jgi:NitT/TauT family transport system permease protein